MQLHRPGARPRTSNSTVCGQLVCRCRDTRGHMGYKNPMGLRRRQQTLENVARTGEVGNRGLRIHPSKDVRS